MLLRCTPKGSMGGLGLNAEHGPDIGKRKRGRYILGCCDNETDTEEGKWGGGLNERRGDACIHHGHLWGENLPGECPHPQELKAYHGGDDDIQAHAQGDPRHSKVDRLALE